MNRKPWRWGVGALISGMALLVACDGSNLFDAEQNPFATPRVTVSVPDGAFAGDTIGISVSATSAQDISSIDIAVRGAANKDTSVTVTTGRSVNATVKLGLPLILTDTMLIVSAVAIDKSGNVSKVRSDTATVLGPPAILSVTGPDSLRLGTSATLQIRAFGSRRITQLDMAIRGAVVKDTTIFVVPPLNDVTQSLTLNIPALAADTALRIGIVAKDLSGLSSPPSNTNLPLAIAPPVATIAGTITGTAPGALLTIPVRATAMRSVSSIKVELSGATTANETITITPPAPDVTRDVTIRLPGDIVDPALTVRAYAIDKSGAISAPATMNVTLTTGAPVISSITCTSCTGVNADSTRGGQVVDIRVNATGVRPLKEITVRFRGAMNQEVTVPVPATPVRTTFTADVSVALPAEVSDTILTVTALATDQAGDVSAITATSTKVLRVGDVTVPTVSATATPGATTAGSAIQIRINARDNVGVRRIGYAVVNPGGDTINGTPTLVTTSGLVKDTTFSFTVPLTITPRTVRVLGIAQDASGRRGYSAAANVVVADSAAPAITIVAPTLNSTLPLNDSVRVSVRAVDPTGVQSIRLRGESVRVDSLGPTRTIQRFAEKVITFPINPGAALPTDTTIIRYLNAVPDSISEPVSIIVTASDSLNNTATSSVSILVGGPRVELRSPSGGTAVVPGGTLSISAYALDRSAGIDSLQVVIGGVMTATRLFKNGCPAPATSCIPGSGLPTNDSILVNFDEVIPIATPLGAASVTATAWNRNRVAGQSQTVAFSVSTTAIADTANPRVRVQLTANDRIELNDTVTIEVGATDVGTSGIRRMGIVVTTEPGGGVAAQPVFYHDTLFSGTGRGGPQTKLFKFTLAQLGYTELNLVRLPRAMTFRVTAFAQDADGNCGANVTNTLATLACSAAITVAPAPTVSGRTDYYTAVSGTPLSELRTVVPGFARPLPTSNSRIADVVVDMTTTRPRMYLANLNLNRLEVLNLQDSTFSVNPVAVGSEPWGLFLGQHRGADGVPNTGDDVPRLIVANSGGTNLSFVDITQPLASVREMPAERVLTPNAVLFDVGQGIVAGFNRFSVLVHDFSDRPQFVAQDANGMILYSTRPTDAALDGTARVLIPQAPTALRPYEGRIIFNQSAVDVSSADGIAIAHVDSIVVERNSNDNDRINIYDHIAGDPSPAGVRQSGYMYSLQAAITAITAQGSDITARAGKWSLPDVGLSDTTFITTSTDKQFVGFGEGGAGPFASVWLWRCVVSAQCPNGGPAAPGNLSDDISVQDLVGNAAERVLGIALNNNGSIGAARGSSSAYYFSNNVQQEGDLRLQGVFGTGVAGGNGGIALHPEHVYDLAAGSNPRTLSFVATVNRSIKIVDTFSFIERGEIQIRDNIVGPLRAALPIGGVSGPFVAGHENFGLAECDQIWVKLFGVTGAGNAVIINVRKRDIINPIITAAACPAP